MYCYTIKTETKYGITDYCDLCSTTPLENASREEIINTIKASGGVGGAMILYCDKDINRIWAERIPTLKYLAEGLCDLWDDFKAEWFDFENVKNKLIRYLVKHTHLYATTVYDFLRKVNSFTELQIYVDELKKERGEA